jgi:1-phosphatidylinositol-3-phosphate 5-kinase
MSTVIWETPLYVRGYSQGVLNKALQGDTQFLASQSVMDYSLLVGIDDETNQLIVGLIGTLLNDFQLLY